MSAKLVCLVCFARFHSACLQPIKQIECHINNWRLLGGKHWVEFKRVDKTYLVIGSVGFLALLALFVSVLLLFLVCLVRPELLFLVLSSNLFKETPPSCLSGRRIDFGPGLFWIAVGLGFVRSHICTCFGLFASKRLTVTLLSSVFSTLSLH